MDDENDVPKECMDTWCQTTKNLWWKVHWRRYCEMRYSYVCNKCRNGVKYTLHRNHIPDPTDCWWEWIGPEDKKPEFLDEKWCGNRLLPVEPCGCDIANYGFISECKKHG